MPNHRTRRSTRIKPALKDNLSSMLFNTNSFSSFPQRQNSGGGVRDTVKASPSRQQEKKVTTRRDANRMSDKFTRGQEVLNQHLGRQIGAISNDPNLTPQQRRAMLSSTRDPNSVFSQQARLGQQLAGLTGHNAVVLSPSGSATKAHGGRLGSPSMNRTRQSGPRKRTTVSPQPGEAEFLRQLVELFRSGQIPGTIKGGSF